MSRPFFDLSFYLVLDPELCGGADGMVETARLAAQSGATLVQLRAPGWKKRALVECARALKRVLSPLSVPLIIDDDADVCLAADADGLHVGQLDLEVHDARSLIGPDRLLGLSITRFEELALVDEAVVDYLGVGPVLATTTKRDAAAAMGFEGLAAVAAATALPCVAIGGIKPRHAARVFASGARGLAVVSAVCGQPDPAAAAAMLHGTIQHCLRG